MNETCISYEANLLKILGEIRDELKTKNERLEAIEIAIKQHGGIL